MSGLNGLQPHKGSSETLTVGASNATSVALQPHKGSSETPRPIGNLTPVWRFNPTRVRLKRHDPDDHHGDDRCFNPTRVRLKHDLDDDRLEQAGASTPQGFV